MSGGTDGRESYAGRTSKAGSGSTGKDFSTVCLLGSQMGVASLPHKDVGTAAGDCVKLSFICFCFFVLLVLINYKMLYCVICRLFFYTKATSV